MAISIERQAAEDQAWSERERADAVAQNEYHRAWKAANDALRAGALTEDLEAALRAALAARTAAEEEALAVYRAAMSDL